MTAERLHQLLYECADMRTDSRLSEIADTLVTTTIVDEESTWKAPVEERILFGLYCMVDWASRNGLDYMWGMCELASAETMASAIEGLEIIGENELLHHARVFWNFMMTPVRTSGVAIPAKYSATTQGAYSKIEELIQNWDSPAELPHDVATSCEKFIGCWDGSLPQSILTWVKTFELQLAARICSDI